MTHRQYYLLLLATQRTYCPARPLGGRAQVEADWLDFTQFRNSTREIRSGISKEFFESNGMTSPRDCKSAFTRLVSSAIGISVALREGDQSDSRMARYGSRS